MERAEGVPAESGVGLVVFKGLGLLLPFMVLLLLGQGGRQLECVIAQVPGGWQ